jgi:isoleucyl-tRNA synthetase
MSKSLGNGILPSEIVDQYGADILRLWVASSDYHADIRISKEILKQLSDAYRKIRNTARYILGNISDFNPDTDMVALEELLPIDRWALAQLDLLNDKVRAGYDAFEFHQVFHAIHNFCVVDMSNFYLDVIKDRLYEEKADGKERRAAQTAMHIILDQMTRMIAPILAYTADEIWESMAHESTKDSSGVVFNEMPEKTGVHADAAFTATWDRIHQIRDDVKKALELARNEKIIGASLDAKVQLFCEGELYDFVKSVESELATVFITSQVEVVNGTGGSFSGSEVEGLSVTVLPAQGEKCGRCWSYSDTVGSDPNHADCCARCAAVLG